MLAKSTSLPTQLCAAFTQTDKKPYKTVTSNYLLYLRQVYLFITTHSCFMIKRKFKCDHLQYIRVCIRALLDTITLVGGHLFISHLPIGGCNKLAGINVTSFDSSQPYCTYSKCDYCLVSLHTQNSIHC